MQSYEFKEIARDSHKLTIPQLSPKQRFTIFVSADHHWDSLHCDRALLKKHLDQAKEIGAPCFFFGDFFDAMQGRWDKRANQEMLRPEHRGNNYLDRLVETAGDWLKPYAANIQLITPGNHEFSIEQHHQTSLTDRLCQVTGCRKGAFSGFVRFTTGGPQGSGSGNSLVLFYHHGYGGGGEVTHGMIDHSRTRSQAMADIFVSGHIHRRNMDENELWTLNNDGTTRSHHQVFLRCGAYKDDHMDERYHQLRGRGPRPKGGWWLHFQVLRTANQGRRLICTPEPCTPEA